MFTGIIQEIGKVAEIRRVPGGAALTVASGGLAGELAPGDSLSVDGACLTVTSGTAGFLALDVSDETLERTTLKNARPGDRVNLEPALRLGDRVGGHLVTGHVDGVGRIGGISRRGTDTIFRVECPPGIIRYLVEKGSLALDGISLTIAAVRGDTAEIHAVPFTLNRTTLSARSPGDLVNLEADILGKYVERLLGAASARPGLTRDSLRAAGFEA